MSLVQTQPIGPRNPWTTIDLGWPFDYHVDGQTAKQREDSEFVNLLASGGLKLISRSYRYDLVARKQTRFLRVAFVLGLLWLVFWFV